MYTKRFKIIITSMLLLWVNIIFSLDVRRSYLYTYIIHIAAVQLLYRYTSCLRYFVLAADSMGQYEQYGHIILTPIALYNNN